MEPICHRCGTSLVDGQPFCPHCGAPQLRVEEMESSSVAEDHVLQKLRDQAADMLRWRAAIVSAFMVAAPAAVLSSLLNLGSMWVFVGGFLTVAIYRRRTSSPTDSKLGWRIGGLMGLLAATLWLAIQGGALVVERYALHRGAEIDGELQGSLKMAIAAMQQKNPAFATEFPWFSHFWLSPDGIAAMLLAGSFALAVSMVIFSAIGGALGGRYLRARTVDRRSV